MLMNLIKFELKFTNKLIFQTHEYQKHLLVFTKWQPNWMLKWHKEFRRTLHESFMLNIESLWPNGL